MEAFDVLFIGLREGDTSDGGEASCSPTGWNRGMCLTGSTVSLVPSGHSLSHEAGPAALMRSVEPQVPSRGLRHMAALSEVKGRAPSIL